MLDLQRQADPRPSHPQLGATDGDLLQSIDAVTSLLADQQDVGTWTTADEAAANRSMVEFRVTGDDSPPRRLRLSGDRYTVGSGVGCSIRLDDDSVRPLHAVLIQDHPAGQPRVTVRAYSVPIEVNGSVVTESSVQIGDRVKLGRFHFERLNPGGEPNPNPSPPKPAAEPAPDNGASARRQQLREAMLADREASLAAQHAAAAQLHVEFESRIERLGNQQIEVTRREEELRRGHALLADERERLRDDAVASRRALAMREKELADRQQLQAEELRQTRTRLDQSRVGAQQATEELRQIRERFAQLSGQITELTDSRDASQRTAAEADAARDAEAAGHRETAAKLADATAAGELAESQRDSALIDRDAAVQACEAAQERFEQTQSSLIEARRRAEDASAAAVASGAQLAAVNAELGRLSSELTDTRRVAEQQTRDAVAHRSLADDLESQLRELADQQAAHVQSHEDAATAVTMAEIEAADALGQLREVDSLRQRAEDELAAAAASLQLAGEQIEQLTAANAELTGQVDGLHELGRRTADELVEVLHDRNAARQDLTAAMTACQIAETGRDEAMASIADAERQTQRAIEEAGEHRGLVADRDREIERLRTTESELLAESRRLQDEFERSGRDAESLREDCRQAEATIAELRTVAEEHLRRGEDTKRLWGEETDQLRGEITSLTEQLAATTERFEFLQSQNTDTAKRLDAVATERGQLEVLLTSVQTQLSELTDNHEALQKHADEVAADRDEITAERDEALRRANEAHDAWDESNRQHDRTLQSIESIEAATRGVIDPPEAKEATSTAGPRLHAPQDSPAESVWSTVSMEDVNPASPRDQPPTEPSESSVAPELGDDPWSSIRWSEDTPSQEVPPPEDIAPESSTEEPSMLAVDEEPIESTMQLPAAPTGLDLPDDELVEPAPPAPAGANRADELIRSLRQQSAAERQRSAPSSTPLDDESAKTSVVDTAAEPAQDELPDLVAEEIRQEAVSQIDPAEQSSDDQPDASIDAPVAAEPENADAEDADPEDDSIEAYMNRLLQRVQGGASPQAPAPVAAKPKPKPPVQLKPPARLRESLAASEDESGQSATEPDVPAEPIRPRSRPPERSQNLQAMRQLANQSARSAIHVSARSQSINTRRKAVMKFACAAAAVGCGLVAILLVFGMLKYIAAAAAVILGGVWFKEGVTLWIAAMKPASPKPAAAAE